VSAQKLSSICSPTRSTSVAQSWCAFFLVFLFVSAAPPLLALDDHNPIGVTGAFEGLITTGCGYNVLNHSATRVIDDIPPVAGSVGKYPLRLRRYWASRSLGFSGGFNAGWRHEYSWSRSEDGGNTIKIEYPNGNVWDGKCYGEYGAPLGVSDSPGDDDQDGSPTFRLADGGRVVFGPVVVNQHTYHSVATKIIDPYGQMTTIAYWEGPDQRGTFFISRVTEPGGRYLQFTYDATSLPWVLSRVEAYDGRNPPNLIDSVVYHYSTILPTHSGSPSPTPSPVNCLTRVDYSDSTNQPDDSTHAHYAYIDDNEPEDWEHGSRKLFPVLRTCQDVRYNGPMRHICYEYQNNGPHGAIIAERYSLNGSTDGPRVSRIDPPAPSPVIPEVWFDINYTEYRGDLPTPRTFTYTPLHITRTFNNETDQCPTWIQNPDNNPAPQQFLKSYTDFRGQTTRLEYDPHWYVRSVTDANLHTTTYTRGPPPPDGIGEITQIMHPDSTHIDYVYNDAGHYVHSISNERQKVTIYTRDGNHRVTRIDYPSDSDTLPSYEEFAYDHNNFGLTSTHHLKNGAYEHFQYDNRGLLLVKTNPTNIADWNQAMATAPQTTYSYYTSGAWIDRVQTMTLPPNVNGLRATETYEYDRSANNTSRGLVTKIIHTDYTFQSFQYDQYGNKVSESNELGEGTDYAYDNYNRVTTVTKHMYGPPDEVTTYDYSPTEGDTTQCYLHTTSSAYHVTAPTLIKTHNGYDANFRKTSVNVAGRTTWFDYDPVGNQTCVTDPRGGSACASGYTTTTDYDTRNRKWHVWDAQGHQTTFTYDSASNVTRIDRPDSNWEEKIYDALNRVIKDTVSFSAIPSQRGWSIIRQARLPKLSMPEEPVELILTAIRLTQPRSSTTKRIRGSE
jgi:YD repeat-containing protein